MFTKTLSEKTWENSNLLEVLNSQVSLIIQKLSETFKHFKPSYYWTKNKCPDQEWRKYAGVFLLKLNFKEFCSLHGFCYVPEIVR